jgi:PAS domain S-box-containing protein
MNSPNKTLKAYAKTLVAITFFVNLFIYLVVLFFVANSKHQYEKEAERMTQNFAQVLEYNFAGIIERVDLSLISLVPKIEEQIKKQRFQKKAIYPFIVDFEKLLPELEGMRLVDENGDVVDLQNNFTSPINVADREYFQTLRNTPKAQLIISPPVKSRITGKWNLVIGRRFNYPDGRFAGAISGRLPLEFLLKQISSLKIGEHGSISLRYSDLSNIVRIPEVGSFGDTVGNKQVSKGTMDAWKRNPQGGTYSSVVAVDNIFRIISFRKIGRFPLYVFVALSPKDFLVPWKNEIIFVSILLLVFTALTIVFARMLFKNFKKESEALKEVQSSEIRYHSLVNAVPDLIWMKDENGIYLSCNKIFETYFRSSEEKIIGKTDYDFVDKETADNFRKNDLNAIKEGKVVVNEEWLFFDDIGYRRLFETKKVPVYYPDGTIQGVLGIAHDITEHRQMADELEAVVEIRTNELKLRSVQLEATNKELEFFTYSVSHDLRSPLRGIDGWSQALLEDFGKELDPRAHEYVIRVKAQAHRMSDLIDDLLKLAKVKVSELRLQEVNLSEMAESVFNRLKNENPENSVEFIVHPNLISICDRNYIEIVLTNLLSNAWKFSSKTSNPKIEFGQIIENDEEIFFVKDNGVGLNTKMATNLFGAFQRYHRESEFPGTGIGLALVKKIINIHNGKIWVESEPNQGATFYFKLKSY